MRIIDNDLLSIQEARILVENSVESQKELLKLAPNEIDKIILNFLDKIPEYLKEYLVYNYDETKIGKVEDELFLLKKFISKMKEEIIKIKCVGCIKKDENEKIIEVGVPYGVIAAFSSEKNSILTFIYYIIIAIKSQNSIVMVCNRKNSKTLSKFLKIAIKLLELEGIPEGTISYLSNVSLNGYKEIINHKNVNLLLNTDCIEILEECKKSGKLMIYGDYGNTPVFIERSANIEEAVVNIIKSKMLNYGVAPGSEQALVVEKVIVDEVKRKFLEKDCYFMTEKESNNLKEILFDKNGSFNKKYIGKSAQILAREAGFEIDKKIKLLITSEKYLTLDSTYAKEKLCPVLDFYIEDDWENACEKCIELLLNGNKGHTLILYSNDKKVIEQFCLRKPVGRILVNSSGVLGSMGIITDFFPAVTLGSGVTGMGVTSDNVSPLNLIYKRKVGYEKFKENSNSNYKKIIEKKIEKSINSELEEKIKKLLLEIIE